jgi:hypothetical protein
MTLGDILKEVVEKDLAHKGVNGLSYAEYVKDDLFFIELKSSIYEESFIACSIPYNGLEAEKNYLRMHFLSMAFNAAVLGMKRLNKNKKIRNRNQN